MKAAQIENMIFRCHSVGELMGVKGLGKTGQKRAIQTFIEFTTGRTKEIKSKYLTKGNVNEQIAIEMVNRVLGTNYIKNEARLFNDYLTGECDLLESDHIADIKNAWDIFTFNEAKSDPNADYEWQGRGYMELYDKPKFKLIYCLTDMPVSLAIHTLNRMADMNGDLDHIQGYQALTNMVFTRDSFEEVLNQQAVFSRSPELEKDFIEIPEQDRVFITEFDRNEQKTNLLYSRIKEAREYLKTIYLK